MAEGKVYVGIDVGKEELEVALGEKAGARLVNGRRGYEQIVRWLRKEAGEEKEVQVICEASGGYEQALVRHLQGAGLRVSLVQASRVRQFARASGLWPRPTGSMPSYCALMPKPCVRH